MKTSCTRLVVLLLWLGILAGCAPGPNLTKATAGTRALAGFWLGLRQGFIAPVVFVLSLFRGELTIYEIHNHGPWYNFGYWFGLACLFGGSGNRAGRRRVKAA